MEQYGAKGTLKSITRRNNSTNGNPSYKVTVQEGEIWEITGITAPDSSFAYNMPQVGATVEVEWKVLQNFIRITDLKEELNVPAGYTAVNWDQVAIGDSVYLCGTCSGKPCAYGPHRIVGRRQLANNRGQAVTHYAQDLIIKKESN